MFTCLFAGIALASDSQSCQSTDCSATAAAMLQKTKVLQKEEITMDADDTHVEQDKEVHIDIISRHEIHEIIARGDVITENDGDGGDGDDSDYLKPLCDAGVVAEAVGNMAGSPQTSVSFDAMRELLSATSSSMVSLKRALGLSSELLEIEGKALCKAAVAYIDTTGHLPPTTDVACFLKNGKPDCNIDVRPSKLAKEGPKEGDDIPDFHDEEVMEHVKTASAMAQVEMKAAGVGVPVPVAAEVPPAKEIDYSVWEAARRIANFFRIYPCKRAEQSAVSFAEVNGSAWPSGGEDAHNAKLQEAIAYTSTAIGHFNNHLTETQMTRWFGSGSFSSSTKRQEVLRVMNAVDHMISNVEGYYPGPQCSSNTYAYVYPRAYDCELSELGTRACTKVGEKYVFYLCALYLNRPSEMIETLVHEGSHHATSYLTDVAFTNGQKAYGRSTCESLATNSPDAAITNADNFCYYIQDVVSQVGGGTATPGRRRAPAPPAACVDVSETSILINQNPATCSQLADYCDHSTYGSKIKSECPATCNQCGSGDRRRAPDPPRRRAYVSPRRRAYVSPSDSCPYANDGECDVPMYCHDGSDVADCSSS